MSQPDNKLDKFSSAVLKDAQEQRAKILQEIEEYRKSQMEKAEEEILHEAYIMIQNEIASIKNQESRKISLAELEGRRKLLKQREEITAKVFTETAGRLLAFTRTPEYKPYLCDRVKKCAVQLPAGQVVIRLKKDDLALSDSLIAACGREATVEAAADIEIGGFIMVNEEMGLVVDETIDLKLRSQKDWFAAASGLTLGL